MSPSTASVDLVVGQSVNFLVGDQSAEPTTQWSASSSDDAVFQVIEPSDDLLSPQAPGGVAVAPGTAAVSVTPPGNGAGWSVRVTVTAS